MDIREALDVLDENHTKLSNPTYNGIYLAEVQNTIIDFLNEQLAKDNSV